MCRRCGSVDDVLKRCDDDVVAGAGGRDRGSREQRQNSDQRVRMQLYLYSSTPVSYPGMALKGMTLKGMALKMIDERQVMREK